MSFCSVFAINTTINAQICSTATFSTLPAITASGLIALEIADVDRDGNPDLAVLRDIGGAGDDGVVEIWRGNGNGGFTSTGILYAASITDPKALAVKDINNDNLLDLVVAGRFAATDWRVSVLRGNGNGTFQPRTTFTVGNEPVALAVGNLDGDNLPEIAIANYSSSDVSILPNLGNGNFGTAFSIQSIGTPNDIKLQDFNNDGRLDFVTTSVITDLATVKINNGNFAFTNATGTPIALGDPIGVTIGDFNGDAKLDFAAANRADLNISVRLSNGDGTFLRPTLDPFAVASGSSPRSVASADYNGDGKSDVVTGNITNSISILLGGNGGNLASFTSFNTEAGTANFIATGNFAGNSRADIAVINSGSTNKITLLQNTCPTRRSSDFDGDGKTDLSIFRPNAAAEWWYQRSSNGGNAATQFGSSTDKPVPADFTGDGKTDAAFFRPSTGQWFILRSEDFTFYAFPFGNSADIPLPGDFDGDGKADATVFRPSSATWYINKSSGGTIISQFGLNGDIPVQADYDGDGKADLAIFRPTLSEWWYVKSSNGQAVGLQFGTAGDKVVPADYTGDGKTDVAVWRPSNGNWFVLRSEDFSFYAAPFGTNGDVPVPGDYDGDGKSDIAIFRGGTWFLQQSTNGTSIQQFGFATDKPVPAAYIP